MAEELNKFSEEDRERQVAHYVREIIARELSQLSTRLQASNPSLFDSYDRLRAEAELRITLFFPLSALILTLAFQWQWWAVVFLLLPMILAVQGWGRHQEANNVVAQALLVGIIHSPIVERIDSWLAK